MIELYLQTAHPFSNKEDSHLEPLSLRTFLPRRVRCDKTAEKINEMHIAILCQIIKIATGIEIASNAQQRRTQFINIYIPSYLSSSLSCISVIFIIPIAHPHVLEAVEQRNLFSSLPTDVSLSYAEITEILFPAEQSVDSDVTEGCKSVRYYFYLTRASLLYTYYTRAMFRAPGRMRPSRIR